MMPAGYHSDSDSTLLPLPKSAITWFGGIFARLREKYLLGCWTKRDDWLGIDFVHLSILSSMAVDTTRTETTSMVLKAVTSWNGGTSVSPRHTVIDIGHGLHILLSVKYVPSHIFLSHDLGLPQVPDILIVFDEISTFLA